tara:strand:+ start:1556 stop:1657 length:102 start_codon:yes stop_codon:yes gene_type:complete
MFSPASRKDVFEDNDLETFPLFSSITFCNSSLE